MNVNGLNLGMSGKPVMLHPRGVIQCAIRKEER